MRFVIYRTSQDSIWPADKAPCEGAKLRTIKDLNDVPHKVWTLNITSLAALMFLFADEGRIIIRETKFHAPAVKAIEIYDDFRE